MYLERSMTFHQLLTDLPRLPPISEDTFGLLALTDMHLFGCMWLYTCCCTILQVARLNVIIYN